MQTLATLKSAHSTLLSYSVQSQEAEARSAYKEACEGTMEIIQQLDCRLKELEYQEPQYKNN